MKLIDLYNRVIGTSGLDVMDLNSLKAAVSNCMADLTSRGYKIFKEICYDRLDDPAARDQAIRISENMIRIPAPNDIRKSVYLRLFFGQDATIATRLSLSNPKVQCRYLNGEFRSKVDVNEAIYYIKDGYLYAEWNTEGREVLCAASFGYYQKLKCPADFPTDPNKASDMNKVEIDIRPEFEDAIVLYAVYFYTARYLKDTDKTNLTLSNYKYYVEDIIHELSYEDEFNEEDAVIKVEDDYE